MKITSFNLSFSCNSPTIISCNPSLSEVDIKIRGVIGKVRCDFLRIYAPIPYSAVFLLHAPVPIKIGFGTVQCGLVQCGLAVWVGLI